MSKRRFLKIGCLLLALLSVFSTFVACDSSSDTEGETAQVSLAEDEKEPVPHYDWKGRVFTVLAEKNPYEPNFEIVGQIGGERVSEDVFYRNVWIEEYYNVKIEEFGAEGYKNLDLLKNTTNAGDNAYDLAFLVRNDMGTAILDGYMSDMTTVEYLNLENDWYNDLTIESMMISGRLFHMVSDFSLVDKARTNVLFLNRDMAAKNNVPDIVEMVREGTWTIEEMIKYAKSNDLNGDGEIGLNDQWGLTNGGKETCVAFWSALDNLIVSFDENDVWSVGVATEHSVNSIELLRNIFDDNISFNGSRWNDYGLAYDVFIDSRSYFMAASLSTLEELSADVEFSYTALPFPKYDVEQESYYTTNDNTYLSTFGIPKCAADPNFSGFMVEVLSWRSSTTTFPAYYEITCKIKKSYDLVCSEMLDVVFDGLIFDFGLVYGNKINLKTKILMESIYTDKAITTLYDGVKTATEGKIDNLFSSVEVLE